MVYYNQNGKYEKDFYDPKNKKNPFEKFKVHTDPKKCSVKDPAERFHEVLTGRKGRYDQKSK